MGGIGLEARTQKVRESRVREGQQIVSSVKADFNFYISARGLSELARPRTLPSSFPNSCHTAVTAASLPYPLGHGDLTVLPHTCLFNAHWGAKVYCVQVLSVIQSLRSSGDYVIQPGFLFSLASVQTQFKLSHSLGV
jgi:hypothetical protein